MGLVNTDKYGAWLYRRNQLWQMGFLSAAQLSQFINDKQQDAIVWQSHIHRLWHFGLLKADFILSDKKLDIAGVTLQKKRGGTYWYSDSRQLKRAAATQITENKSNLATPSFELRFHPFRYYVVHQLLRAFHIKLPTFAAFEGEAEFVRQSDSRIKSARLRTSSTNFVRRVERWNDITALAIATEPLTLPGIIGEFRLPWTLAEDAFSEALEAHWKEISKLYKDCGLDEIDAARSEICTDLRKLQPDDDMLKLLRIAGGKFRQNIRGLSGGAMHLFTMAETIRSAAEQIFDQKLLEEDDAGSGWPQPIVKETFYGSPRLFDGDAKVAKEFLRRHGLGHGVVRVRWYVEGATEYGALNSLFAKDRQIEIIDLHGRFVENKKNWSAFLDSLQRDQEQEVFSFISLDRDREDNWRSIKSVAGRGAFFGNCYAHDPDFEFANFSRSELLGIIWSIAEEKGAEAEDRVRLQEATDGAETVDELLYRSSRALPSLKGLSKGERWGKYLMRFAWMNDKMADGKTRPIIEAVKEASRSIRHYSYRRAVDDCDVRPGHA